MTEGSSDCEPVAEKGESSVSVVYRRISGLKLDPENPRVHTSKQIRQIARSIETFGFNVPVLINSSSKVIAGHGRIMACQFLGRAKVPTICLDHLTEAQARAFMIADNRLTEISIWDDRLLAEQLKDLSVVDLGFSLEVTGFDMGEIDLRIEGLNEQAEGPEDPADEVPEMPNGPVVSLTGDLWVLGGHRVLCGNCLDEASFVTLMDDSQAAAAFTDPPYNVRIEGNVSGLGALHHREFAMASGEMTPAEFTTFLEKVCSQLALHSTPGSLHYVAMDWRHLGELLTAGQKAYTELKNVCIWAKNQAGMGSLYRSQHELIFVFKNGHAPHRNNILLGQYGRNRSNVWHYPSASSFSKSGDEGNLLALHPTVKPVELVADVIMDCTERNDIVLDAFLGSGTTVIAAERTGRRCFGLEIDPKYVDTVVRRWQTRTGQVARNAMSSLTFEEAEAEAEKIDGRS